jgi:predicted permease
MLNIIFSIFIVIFIAGCSSSNNLGTSYYTNKHGISAETVAKNGYMNASLFDLTANLLTNSSEIMESVKNSNNSQNANFELKEIDNKFYEDSYNVYGYDKNGYNRKGYDK